MEIANMTNSIPNGVWPTMITPLHGFEPPRFSGDIRNVRLVYYARLQRYFRRLPVERNALPVRSGEGGHWPLRCRKLRGKNSGCCVRSYLSKHGRTEARDRNDDEDRCRGICTREQYARSPETWRGRARREHSDDIPHVPRRFHLGSMSARIHINGY